MRRRLGRSCLSRHGLRWRQERALREQGFDVVTPDLAGFGTEPLPSKPFSFIDRIAALLPAMIVGNSNGSSFRS